MLVPIMTATLVGIITLLTYLLTKLLAILVGALLLYFCPLIFLMFVAGAGIYLYRKRIMRKVTAVGRLR